MNRLFLLVGALLSLVSAAPASADPLRYTISDASGIFGSFVLDDHPAYDLPTLEDYAFFIYDVPGTFSDGGYAAGLSFYTDDLGGGLSIVTRISEFSSGVTLDLGGMALFTGPTSAPVLLAFGPTQFTDLDTGAFYTISAVSLAAVPEPASWAMLVIGAGLTGAAVRRRAAARTALA